MLINERTLELDRDRRYLQDELASAVFDNDADMISEWLRLLDDNRVKQMDIQRSVTVH